MVHLLLNLTSPFFILAFHLVWLCFCENLTDRCGDFSNSGCDTRIWFSCLCCCVHWLLGIHGRGLMLRFSRTIFTATLRIQSSCLIICWWENLTLFMNNAGCDWLAYSWSQCKHNVRVGFWRCLFGNFMFIHSLQDCLYLD